MFYESLKIPSSGPTWDDDAGQHDELNLPKRELKAIVSRRNWASHIVWEEASSFCKTAFSGYCWASNRTYVRIILYQPASLTVLLLK